MRRHLQPELLDTLPPDSSAALRSRRDLVRLDKIMGNTTWFARTVPPLARPGETALELGAGEGRLALALRASGLPTDALDRFPASAEWSAASPAAARWHVADLRAFAGWTDYPVVVGNLILHHLDAPALAALGAQLDRHARVLVFNEPLRHPRIRLLWTIGAPLGGAGPVTRHDGRVSIEAGFRDDELPRLLGLPNERWSWQTTSSAFGAHRVIATRRP